MATLHENLTLWNLAPLVVITGAAYLLRKLLFLITGLAEARRQKPIPALIKSTSAFAIYFLAFMTICWHYLGVDIAKITLFTSLVAGVMVYLLQQLLRDGLSGILLNISSPFGIHDIVRIGDHEGRVIDITWRETVLLSVDNNIVSIPNNDASAKTVVNYTRPNPITRSTLHVLVSADAEANVVSSVIRRGLDAALQMGTVLSSPPPIVRLREFTYPENLATAHIKYVVFFYFDVRLCTPSAAAHDVMTCVTCELKRGGFLAQVNDADSGPTDAVIEQPSDSPAAMGVALLSPAQVQLIKASWKQAKPLADDVVDRFYQRLFDENSDIKKLFRTSRAEQRSKLVAMLGFLVSQIDRPEGLIAATQELALRHRTYGVKNEYFDVVGATLLSSFSDVLGESFTPDVRAAWLCLYCRLADIMRT